MAEDPEDAPRLRATAFLRLLLLHLSVRDAIRLLEGQGELRIFWALGFALCFAASFHPAALRAASVGALSLATSKLAAIFPHSSNHFLLEYLCLVFASLVGWRRDDELAVFVRSLRCLPVLVLLWSGVNKALYGTYFNGAFLATALPGAGFANVFGLLLGSDELAGLLAARPPGPYRFSSPLALLASNGVWVGEIVCGVLLLLPRWRRLGLIGAVALLVGIELGAFEVMFGTLMLNLLVLFAPAVWNRRMLVASAFFYASLLGAKLGLLPIWAFN